VHLKSFAKVPMRVKRGLFVNLAKRLKMDAEKMKSASEEAKAEKCRNEDAVPK
jgi:hypothetical protein